MKKFKSIAFGALIALLAFQPAQAAYKEKTDLTNATGVLAEEHGGTDATALGSTLTNANNTLNVTQPPKVVLTSTYSVVAGDAGYIISYEGASPSDFTLPAAVTAGFTSGFAVTINAVAGGQAVTVTPTGSTIGGDTELVIQPGTGCLIYSNGSNYLLDYSACSAVNGASLPGSDTEALFNDGGAFGASPLLTFGTTLRATGPFEINAPAFADTGVMLQATGSDTSSVRMILQNVENVDTSNAAEFLIGANNMTATTHFLKMGYNSSLGGNAPYANANAAFLYALDNELNLGAHGASGTINLNTGATPTNRMAISTTAITSNLPWTHSNNLTLGGALSWPSGLGAITEINPPLDQDFALSAGVPTTDIDGTNITISTNTGGSPSFGTNNRGGDMTFSTGDGRQNSSNSGGRGGNMTITLGNAASFANGGAFSLTTGNGGALGSSQNGSGGDATITTGTGATSSISGSYNGGRAGYLNFTGGVGGIASGTSRTAGAGGGATFTAGVGGASTATSNGTGGQGGTFTFSTANGGAATGGSGTRTGGAGGDFLVNLGSGGSGLTASGRSGRLGVGTGTSPQARVDFNVGSMLVRGGTAPTISACGTSPSVTGSSSSFKVTMGSGTLTACTINFGEGFQTAPQSCTITPADATAAATGTTGAYVSAISTTQVTITGLNLTDADYYVQCF